MSALEVCPAEAVTHELAVVEDGHCVGPTPVLLRGAGGGAGGLGGRGEADDQGASLLRGLGGRRSDPEHGLRLGAGVRTRGFCWPEFVPKLQVISQRGGGRAGLRAQIVKILPGHEAWAAGGLSIKAVIWKMSHFNTEYPRLAAQQDTESQMTAHCTVSED